MSETTLRDTIEQAAAQFDTQEQVETPAPQDSPTEQFRDDHGRFAKPQEEVTEAPQEVQLKPRPSSWKKDYEEHWGKLDPSLQDYIHQREAEYAKGVSTYKSQWDSAQPIYEAMQQFLPDLQQHNIQPAQWIQNLGMAHKTLAMGSPEQKLQMFAQLANQYGVPLQGLTGQQADPQFSALAQELNQIKNQWTAFQTQQQQLESNQLMNEIDTFKQGAEFFEDVRESMAQLLEAGIAKNLQDAYDKATRLNGDIWSKIQAKQAPQIKDPIQVAAEKKAKAVSPRSAAPTGSVNGGNGKKDIRSLLAEQVDAALGGRV